MRFRSSRLFQFVCNVFAAHYVGGYSVDEAAKIMGCSPAAARTRLHRGRRKLQQELTRMDVDGIRSSRTYGR
ncbi:RNA polymerase sigma factor [Collinsella tanakaei]|uniref:RNA polymerase sigma factor 70 region 4 type 2 domain-containing protein n=1 Tax=Collinsella tanakaei TaxID=626935 RepID=A0A3E4QRH3_9ACTN|nr:hypothetical protein DXC81_07300 [Collinsella tanakaei]